MTLLLWLKYGLHVDVLDTKKIMYVCVHTHLVVKRHSLLETAGLCEHGGIALSTTAISFFVLSCIQNVHQSSMCQNLLYAYLCVFYEKIISIQWILMGYII